jgi:tetratricopeptide (TPR) repeat protein
MSWIAILFATAAQILFNVGVEDVDSGRLERARLTLQTLVNTYPEDPLAKEAKAQLEAIEIYQDGQQLMQQGRFGAAQFTFETLLSVYPESQLAKPAQAALKEAAKAQEELTVRLTVRGVDLSDVGLDADELRKLFEAHEVRLAAGKAFDPRDVEQARSAVTARLSELGVTGARVRSEVRMAGPHEVDVVLARVK